MSYDPCSDLLTVPSNRIAMPGSVPEGWARLASASGAPRIRHWNFSLCSLDYVVDAYLGSFTRDKASQDGFLIAQSAGRLVLAVADGVTPTSRTPNVTVSHGQEYDGAQYAVRCVLQEIRSASYDGDLTSAFMRANRALRTSTLVIPPADCVARDLPQAAVVAAEVAMSPAGDSIDSITVTRAADCDVWIRTGATWSLRTDRPMLSETARLELARWDSRNRGATYMERLVVEERLGLNDPGEWNSTALGRFPGAKIESDIVLDDCDEVLIVTDGARLDHWKWQDQPCPETWLMELRQWEFDNLPSHRQHSDVAVVWLHDKGRKSQS